MDNTLTYRVLDQAQRLMASFPQGATTDDVRITIYSVDDSTTDVNAAAMTNINATDWTYSWTPSESDFFIITYYNATLDVFYKEFCKVSGTLTGVPGGAGTGSTQTVLRSKFLRYIDNYNASDLTGTNSSGDIADICINEALQIIYQMIKSSRYMDAYASTSLASTADQAYIELSAISDLDELLALKDTTNVFTLLEISPWEYFAQVPSPANKTGTPYRYCRIFNRIYLDPRPTAVITYTSEYKKTYARLASDSDTALIPSKFDAWIMEEARIKWLMMEDISNVNAIQVSRIERDRIQEIAMADIGSQFNRISQAASNFGLRGPGTRYDWNHVR